MKSVDRWHSRKVFHSFPFPLCVLPFSPVALIKIDLIPRYDSSFPFLGLKKRQCEIHVLLCLRVAKHFLLNARFLLLLLLSSHSGTTKEAGEGVASHHLHTFFFLL